jgi:hypothetical protein
MAGTVMPAPKFLGLDNNANPVSGGKLYTYLAGTTTPQPTYSDVNLTVANANPVVLDSAGRATVFLSGTSYKFVLTDANDVTIWTQDNVQAVAPFSTNLDIEGVAGETILAGQVCYLSDGSGALTAGRWYLADADNAYSSSGPQIAIAPDEIASGESGTFRLQGAVTKSNAQADFVVGSTYYVSATAGQLSLTPGTNQRVVGQADSTTTLVISPNPPNVAVTPTFVDGITVTSTDAGASAGPYLDLYRESASPAASDQIGDVRFSGEDSAGNKQLYARMYGQIADPTSTTEDGQLRWTTIRNGVETLALVLDESGNLFPDGASQTMGTATKPWLVYHIGSGGSLNFSNSDVTITHSTNTLTFAGASSGYVFNDGNATIGAAGDTAERHCQFRNNAVQFYVGVEGSSGNRFIGSAVDNAFIGTTGADGLEFATNNTVRMVLLSDGTLKTSSTVSVGNATPSTSGAGITFPASQSASSDANTLDDYEEGTFTATLKGSTTDPTTPVTTTGYYTKIGRQVSLVIAFQNIITTGAAGNVSVTGLPFAPANVQPVGAAAAQSFTTGAVTSLASTIATGSTTLSFYGTTNNSSLLDLVHSAGTSRYLFAQITYFV